METMTRIYKSFPDNEFPPELLELFSKVPAVEYPAELESKTRAAFVEQIQQANETPAETIDRLAGKLGVQAEILTATCGKLATPNAHTVAIATALVNLANCKPSHRWYYVKRLREEREKAARAELDMRPGDVPLSINPDGTVKG